MVEAALGVEQFPLAVLSAPLVPDPLLAEQALAPPARLRDGRASCFDKAAAESFNSTIKVEHIHRNRFAIRAEARVKIATWIVDFYNT